MFNQIRMVSSLYPIKYSLQTTLNPSSEKNRLLTGGGMVLSQLCLVLSETRMEKKKTKGTKILDEDAGRDKRVDAMLYWRPYVCSRVMDSVNISTWTVAAAMVVEGRGKPKPRVMTSHLKPKRKRKNGGDKTENKRKKQTLVEPKCEQRHRCTKEQFGYKMEFNTLKFRRHEVDCFQHTHIHKHTRNKRFSHSAVTVHEGLKAATPVRVLARPTYSTVAFMTTSSTQESEIFPYLVSDFKSSRGFCLFYMAQISMIAIRTVATVGKLTSVVPGRN